jgi:hypothetical protein
MGKSNCHLLWSCIPIWLYHFLTARTRTAFIKYHEGKGTHLQSHEESAPSAAAAQGKQEMFSQILTELLSSSSNGKT